MAAFSLEQHAKHHAVDPPKIWFFATKIVAERFFDNLSADILDHHSTLQIFYGDITPKWVHFTPSVNHSSGVKHQMSEFTPRMSGVHSFSNSLQWSVGPKE